MVQKLFRDKMWRVAEGFVVFYNIPDYRGVLSVLSCSKALVTEVERDAVEFILNRQQARCPYCGGKKACFDSPRFLECDVLLGDSFDWNNFYCVCRCVKSGQDFILQKRLVKSDVFLHCVFCGSKGIVKKAVNPPRFAHISCRQCKQSYTLKFNGEVSELENDFAVVTHVEFFGKYRYVRGDFDNPAMKSLNLGYKQSLFVEDVPVGVSERPELLSFCKGLFEKNFLEGSTVANCVPSKKREKVEMIVLSPKNK
ncbi:MAG: hypothetical protein ABH864_06500 [archaeon]